MEPIIRTENLKFSYKNQEDGRTYEVLKGIDMEVRKGEFLCVLGHNGSGKSTLAKHFNSILVPTEGKVFVGDMDTSDEDKLFDIRQRVGMVFQNPDNQIVATIVEEDIAFAPENLGLPREEIISRVDFALKTVNMEAYRNHAPHKLSGGQKQRVAIAGVLAMMPEVIVLDEPTAMLDPVGRKEIMNTIKTLNREKGMTVVLITHYMDEAAEADRILVMDKGKIKMEGTPKEVFSKVDEVKAIGLDVPQATALAFELNKNGFNLPLDILNTEDCVSNIIKELEND
ncbi:MAG: energy-coupling factor transporter ATPase [Clostridia bacterium]|nr:energy-coupling factor transporter ATPase [Clostridia bacterium]